MAPADASDRRDVVRARRTDVLVAAGTAVVSLGLLVGVPAADALERADTTRYPSVGGVPWTLLVVALLAQSAVLLAARRAPRSTVVVVAAVPVLLAAVSSTTLFGLTALPVVVAVVLAALRLPLPRLWPVAAAAAVLVTAGTATDFGIGYGAFRASFTQGFVGSVGQGVLQAVGAVGLPLVVTLAVRSRRELRAARRGEAAARDHEAAARTAEAAARTAEADARIEAAIGRERAAMARELHDIAAHHLSGIALMSAAVDRQIDTDPRRAHEGVRQVREQSTAVLEDLRRLVGLLREDGPAERAVETIAGIVDLVDRSRARMSVELEVLASDDRPLADGIGPLAQLAAYRAVQESLANAVLHAPGAPCTVTVDDRAAERLVVRVENGAPTLPGGGGTAAGGNGLRGMRERADLVGACLQAGPQDGGGWAVELTFGREAPIAPTTEVRS